jgi:precorrin isomerase
VSRRLAVALPVGFVQMIKASEKSLVEVLKSEAFLFYEKIEA